ncbi:peptide-methionine (S)-S-oxide reductase MsrA [Mycoplasmopsis lipofaciens]|uniref:peptide-methionine (S)-S-oxide reductase MsrA n=1 Tax=Mycoplasmopsis lipofaciens TaxID=114884 RepID=UPI0004862F05|nr:peptide-methionine (S)-S-oxide reductase MsrA [Mycoplasmopsis lipofaciens]
MKRIYLAGGCFWGVQAYFKTIKGVIFTTVGYANSNIENPTYQMLKEEKSTAVETTEVYYDENQISLSEIIIKLFDAIDPTTLNRQGPDFGIQYRSGIYYEISSDLKIIKQVVNEYQQKLNKPIVTEIIKLKNYYLAEEYHQNYTDKNKNVICHIKF